MTSNKVSHTSQVGIQRGGTTTLETSLSVFDIIDPIFILWSSNHTAGYLPEVSKNSTTYHRARTELGGNWNSSIIIFLIFVSVSLSKRGWISTDYNHLV